MCLRHRDLEFRYWTCPSLYSKELGLQLFDILPLGSWHILIGIFGDI